MKTTDKYLRMGLTAAFTVAAWAFFGFAYRWHLLYTEGHQLFLWTGEYVREIFSHAGAAADYAARWIVQFYHLPALGAAFIALSLLALQQGVRRIAARLAGDAFWPLSFVPSAVYWSMMCDGNYTLVGLLALTVAVWTALWITGLKRSGARAAATAVACPLLWLAVGGAASVAVVIVAAAEIADRRRAAVFAAAAAAVAVVAVLWYAVPWQADTAAMITGGCYYYFAEVPVAVFYKIWIATAAAAMLPRLLGRFAGRWIDAALAAVLVAGTAAGVWQRYDGVGEETMGYYSLTHYGRWNEVLRRAEKRAPATRPAMICVNLSLAATGQTGERLFDFPQHSPAGLFMTYGEDILFCGEVLYRLGFINEARHYAYESMAATPDRQRGAFFVVRLAETNLVAGCREVARKYLDILTHTLFYRSWARRMLEIIDSEDAVEAHPVYGALRRMQPTENFAFVADDFGRMLEVMAEQRPDNRPVYDYLLAYYLLLKDVDKFADRLIIPAKGLPRAYAEAFAMICRIKHIDPAVLPRSIDRAVFERLERYIRAYNLSGNNPAAMSRDWGRTYWYYTNFVKF